MIKSVFFDIDGTLISFKTHKMPESTKLALKKLREKGIKLFIATGRSPFAIPVVKHLLDFEFDGYVMLNGQYCVIDNKVIRDTPLPKESFKYILPYMEKNKIACEFLELDYTYSNLVNDRVLELRKFLGNTVSTFLIEMPGCRGVRWNPLFVDVIPENGGKGMGIKAILDYLGFSKDEAMAFGDGGNDIEMLEFVKYGVAMGNSGENVKKSAAYVTDDVDSDGIYNALVHYNVLENK